jgi:hypothetical protein
VTEVLYSKLLCANSLCWLSLCLRLIMVLMESAVSGHKRIKIRERLADKLEVIAFDPYSKYARCMTGLLTITWQHILLHFSSPCLENFWQCSCLASLEITFLLKEGKWVYKMTVLPCVPVYVSQCLNSSATWLILIKFVTDIISLEITPNLIFFNLEQVDLNATCISWWPEFFWLSVDV